MKPFTTLAAVVFGIMAVAHLYRLVQPFDVVVGSATIPQWVSGAALFVTGVLSLMLWREARTR